MIDSGKYFASSKKSNLSDISKEDTDPEKSDLNVFEEGLDSLSCRSILFDCLEKVNEIFANSNTLKENQIKGEKQLTDLAETVNSLSEKFHKFETNRKFKKEIIKSLRGQVSVLHDDLKNCRHNILAETVFFFMR